MLASGRARRGSPQHSAIVDEGQVIDAYSRWAPVYDLIFEDVMRQGRLAAAKAANRIGGRILDVGVGTGLELSMFDPRTHVSGIDLSEPMLRRARQRVQRLKLRHVEGLMVMDGARLAFCDASFDVVVLPYVLTVVPDAARVLGDVLRVVKPGGEIVLVNHFGAEGGVRARMERWLGRHAAALGWHPQFPFAELQDWVSTAPGVTLVERRLLKPFGLFTLVRLKTQAV